MAKRVAIFNHKGGVSKTTSVYNIAILNHFLGRVVRVNFGEVKFLTVSK